MLCIITGVLYVGLSGQYFKGQQEPAVISPRKMTINWSKLLSVFSVSQLQVILENTFSGGSRLSLTVGLVWYNFDRKIIFSGSCKIFVQLKTMSS